MSQKNAFFEWPQPSGILSDINFDILFGIRPEVSSSIQPNIRTLCLIVSLAFYLEKVLPFYLTSSLALLLSDIYSCILSGLCHICWYSICLAFSLAYILASHLACIFAIYLTFYLQKFYLAFFLGLPCDNLFFYTSACGIIWHFISHVFGHFLWHFICYIYIYKHSIWHSFSHSFWHMSGSVYAHIVIWSSLSILSIWNSARACVKASRLKKLETLTWQVGNDATEAS